MTWKPFCAREGCSAPLGWNNHSGLCRDHRRKPKSRAPRVPQKRDPAKLKEYRLANAEQIRAYNRAYYLAHKAEIAARTAAWAKANPEKVAEYRAVWSAKGQGRNYEHRRAVKALEASRASIRTLPRIKALDDLARVRATQKQYGIERVAMV